MNLKLTFATAIALVSLLAAGTASASTPAAAFNLIATPTTAVATDVMLVAHDEDADWEECWWDDEDEEEYCEWWEEVDYDDDYDDDDDYEDEEWEDEEWEDDDHDFEVVL